MKMNEMTALCKKSQKKIDFAAKFLLFYLLVKITSILDFNSLR